MINNLLVSMIFLLIAWLLAKDFINSIYPGLFDMLLRIIRKILVFSIKIVFWPLGFVLTKFFNAISKKELPGRRK